MALHPCRREVAENESKHAYAWVTTHTYGPQHYRIEAKRCARCGRVKETRQRCNRCDQTIGYHMVKEASGKGYTAVRNCGCAAR